jgi:hypothetical protein
MKKKIIVIHYTPLVNRLKEAFMLELFSEAGYMVEYYDISAFARKVEQFNDELKEMYIHKFDSFKMFQTKLLSNDPNTTVLLFPFEVSLKKYSYIYKFIKSSNFCLIRIHIYPKDALEITSLKHLVKVAFSYSFVRMFFKNIPSIIYKFTRGNKIEKTYDYYFSCSFPRTHFINSPNYEVYQKTKFQYKRLIKDKYILFLDSYFPLHPECAIYSKNNSKHSRDYYNSMRIFFDYLEVRFKMSVVIAAHPSSSYTNNEFGDRIIIRNQTSSLTKYAEIAIQHGTMSHVFAVLFDKPLVFVYTKQMKYYLAAFSDYKIKNLALLFGKKAYNIDRISYKKIDFTKIDENVKKKYIYSQLTSQETENMTNSEIMLKEFEKMFAKMGIKNYK